MNSEEIDSLKEQKSKHVLKSIVDNFGFKIVKFGRYKKTGKHLIGFKNNIDWICDQYGEKIVGRSWNEALGKVLGTVKLLVLTNNIEAPILISQAYPLAVVENRFYNMKVDELCIHLGLLGCEVNLEI